MGQVLLVRHGQASWGARDYDVLSAAGWAQSRLLGKALAGRGIAPSLVVHGTMRRHRDTAAALLEALGGTPPLEVDAGWDEFDHVGVLSVVPPPFEGREPTPREFQTWFEGATDRWTGGKHDADYGESFAAFGDRVAGALRRTADHLGRSSASVLVLTSGGPISWVAASLLGADLDAGARRGLSRRLNPVCVNTGVTKVVTGRRGLSLVSFNEHAHLDGSPELLTYR